MQLFALEAGEIRKGFIKKNFDFCQQSIGTGLGNIHGHGIGLGDILYRSRKIISKC